MSDGSITFDTKLNSTGVKEQLKDLQSQLKNLQSEYAKANADLAKYQKKLNANPFDKNLQWEVKAGMENVSAIEDKMASLNTQISSMQGIEQMAAEADKTTESLNRMYDKYAKMVAMGRDPNSSAFKNLQYDIEKAEAKLDELYAKMEKERPGTAAGLKASLAGAMDQQKRSLAEYTKSFVNAADTQTVSLNKVNKAAKSLGKGIFSLGNMFRMLVIRMAMRAAIKAVQEGFTNLAAYSKEANAQLSSLKNTASYFANSLAAAFSPILNVVAPIFSQLIDWIVAAINALNQFFAILGGKKTYTVAVKSNKQLANAISGTGSAAKKASEDEKKSLASFDEINQLNLQNSSDSSSGGSGSASGLFETLPVVNQLTDTLDRVKSLISDGFWDAFGEEWKARVSEIQNDCASIQKSLTDIFQSPDVSSAMSNMTDSFLYNLGEIGGSAALIGVTAGELLVGSLESYLSRSGDFLKQAFSNMFNGLAETFDWVGLAAKTTASILSVFGNQWAQDVLGDIIGFFSTAILTGVDIIIGIVNSVLQLIVQPISDNVDLIKEILNSLGTDIATILNPIFTTFQDFCTFLLTAWDTYFAPFFDSIAEGLSTLVGNVLENLITYVLPALQEGAQTIATAWAENIQPLIDDMNTYLGPAIQTILDALSSLFNNAIVPLFSWISAHVMPIIAAVIKILTGTLYAAIVLIGSIVKTVFKIISDVVSSIQTIFSGLVEFVAGVFTGDWSKAWNGIKDIFRGVWDGIASICENVVNGIVDALNKLSFDVPDWVPLVGGNHFGFSLSHVSIPRLATGTVIPPSAGEFAAILGDNNNDTEVVSPLETMKEAMLEALQESGGGQKQIVLKFDGNLSELARILKPELEQEDRRAGVQLVVEG